MKLHCEQLEGRETPAILDGGTYQILVADSIAVPQPPEPTLEVQVDVRLHGDVNETAIRRVNRSLSTVPPQVLRVVNEIGSGVDLIDGRATDLPQFAMWSHLDAQRTASGLAGGPGVYMGVIEFGHANTAAHEVAHTYDAAYGYSLSADPRWLTAVEAFPREGSGATPVEAWAEWSVELWLFRPVPEPIRVLLMDAYNM